MLLCCVVNENVFKSCVNSQSIVLKCHLGIPSAQNAHIFDNVLAIKYLMSLRRCAKWKYGAPTKLIMSQFQLILYETLDQTLAPGDDPNDDSELVQKVD